MGEAIHVRRVRGLVPVATERRSQIIDGDEQDVELFGPGDAAYGEEYERPKFHENALR